MVDFDLLERWGRDLHEVEQKFEPSLYYDVEAFRERDIRALSSPDALYLIAELDGRPIGYTVALLEALPDYLALSGRDCVIEVLYVEEAARGRGVGTALLETCLAWAKKQRVKRVRAGIYAQNRASLGLFERLGLHAHHVTVLKTLA